MRKETTHWDATVHLIWNVEALVDGLDTTFKTYGVRTILDCACGTGDIAIGLAKRGYAITCADADADMVELTKTKAKKAQATISIVHARWSELTNQVQGPYDAIMVRGNSLPYVISWREEMTAKLIDTAKADRELIASFAAMRTLLAPQGIIYFDTNKPGESEQREVVGTGTLGNKPAYVAFTTHHKGNDRTVEAELTIGKTNTTRKYQSYNLSVEKILTLMEAAGFSKTKVRQITIPGEHHYQPYVILR